MTNTKAQGVNIRDRQWNWVAPGVLFISGGYGVSDLDYAASCLQWQLRLKIQNSETPALFSDGLYR